MATMDNRDRGFSYMAESIPQIGDLQLIEGEELERTWRMSRRERLKQQEDKIWEQFCGEKDIVNSVCGDDPYVFVEELPESYIKELMERELEKFKRESIVQQADFEQHSVEMDQHTVTFVDKEDTENIHIFDDDADQMTDGSNSPPTVRELSPMSNHSTRSPSPTMMTSETPPTRSSPPTPSPPSSPLIGPRPKSPQRIAPKENVRGLIESSIYCAKLKELRWKINEALMDFMDSLQCQSLCNVYPENFVKLKKHSLEFSTRFNRVYMYQLQRQLNDIKRHNSRALPYAKHTHFQAQMVRVTSLHQNILQAILVYYKCFGQSLLLHETSSQVKSLLNTIRECTELCTNIAAPNDLRAAKDLYVDDVLSTCDHVDQILVEYDKKIDAIVTTADVAVPQTRRGKSKSPRGRKKPSKAKSADKASRSIKKGTDSNLSMYSLDKANSANNIKSSRSNTTSKLKNSTIVNTDQVSTNNKVEKNKAEKNDKDSAKVQKKPLRRPLMRGPRVPLSLRTPRLPPDEEVHTMVEAINDTVRTRPSSRTSGVHSPLSQNETYRSVRSRDSTPRNGLKSHTTTPRQTLIQKFSPRKNKLKPIKPQDLIKLDTISSEQEVKFEGFQRESVAQTDYVVKVDGDTSLHVDKNKKMDGPIVGHDVSALLHKLCGGDGNKNKMQYSGGHKNVQLLTINSGSPRQPTTPQLLKILEETIQKKPTKHHRPDGLDFNKCLLPLVVGESSMGALRQYRTRFVQHMLASPMYANSDIGKPWELVGRVSEKIIDELLANCAKEMQLHQLTHQIYTSETK